MLEVINKGWGFSHIDVGNEIAGSTGIENTQNDMWKRYHPPHTSMLNKKHGS